MDLSNHILNLIFTQYLPVVCPKYFSRLEKQKNK